MGKNTKWLRETDLQNTYTNLNVFAMHTTEIHINYGITSDTFNSYEKYLRRLIADFCLM
jgi:hypothetical protein